MTGEYKNITRLYNVEILAKNTLYQISYTMLLAHPYLGI